MSTVRTLTMIGPQISGGGTLGIRFEAVECGCSFVFTVDKPEWEPCLEHAVANTERSLLDAAVELRQIFNRWYVKATPGESLPDGFDEALAELLVAIEPYDVEANERVKELGQ